MLGWVQFGAEIRVLGCSMAGLGITIVRTNVGLMDNVDYYVIDLSLKPSSSISWMGIAPVAWDRLGFSALLFKVGLIWV